MQRRRGLLLLAVGGAGAIAVAVLVMGDSVVEERSQREKGKGKIGGESGGHTYGRLVL